MNIIRHAPLPNFHMDDHVGVALLMSAHPGADVITVDPNYPIDPNNAEHSSSFFVDVGGRYDGVRLFDHHHDPTLPCSAVLVARALGFEDFATSQAAVFMSAIDTMGYDQARRATGISGSRECSDMVKVIPRISLTREFASAITDVVAKTLVSDSYDVFIKAVYDAAPSGLKEAAMESMAVQKREDVRVVESAVVRSLPSGKKVVFLEKNADIGLVLAKNPKTEVVVSPSPLDDTRTKIVRVSWSKYDLKALAERLGMEIVFCHQNGFLVILEGRAAGSNMIRYF